MHEICEEHNAFHLDTSPTSTFYGFIPAVLSTCSKLAIETLEQSVKCVLS